MSAVTKTTKRKQPTYKLTAEIPKTLGNQFKKTCIDMDLSVDEAVKEAIAHWVAEQKEGVEDIDGSN